MSILAAVMPAPRVPVELRAFPAPAVEPGSVLLRALYAEVCGIDVHVWHGRLSGVLNQALADADAMRLPKALVRPQ